MLNMAYIYYIRNKKFKTIIWIGSSLKDLQDCHETVKDEVGYALHVAQQGEMPSNAKLLKGLPGIIEIKTDYNSDAYRTVYAVKLGKKLYVLHVFKKKSKKGISTPKSDINMIKIRFKIAQNRAREEK